MAATPSDPLEGLPPGTVLGPGDRVIRTRWTTPSPDGGAPIEHERIEIERAPAGVVDPGAVSPFAHTVAPSAPPGDGAPPSSGYGVSGPWRRTPLLILFAAVVAVIVGLAPIAAVQYQCDAAQYVCRQRSGGAAAALWAVALACYTAWAWRADAAAHRRVRMVLSDDPTWFNLTLVPATVGVAACAVGLLANGEAFGIDGGATHAVLAASFAVILASVVLGWRLATTGRPRRLVPPAFRR